MNESETVPDLQMRDRSQRTWNILWQTYGRPSYYEQIKIRRAKMKKVTLIIPDEFDKMLSIVVVGNARTGGVNVAQRLEILDSDEITIDLTKEINNDT